MYIDDVVESNTIERVTPEYILQESTILVTPIECGFCSHSDLIRFLSKGNKLIGCVSISHVKNFQENYLHIGTPAQLQVEEDYRRSGYGSQLLFCAVAYAIVNYKRGKSPIFIIEASKDERTGDSNTAQLSNFLLKNGVEVEAKNPPSYKGSEAEGSPYFEVSAGHVENNEDFGAWLNYWQSMECKNTNPNL